MAKLVEKWVCGGWWVEGANDDSFSAEKVTVRETAGHFFVDKTNPDKDRINELTYYGRRFYRNSGVFHDTREAAIASRAAEYSLRVAQAKEEIAFCRARLDELAALIDSEPTTPAHNPTR